MEQNTDRLFWTLTSIIVGALLLTISVKTFPGVANSVVKPISGITKQADTSTKSADQAFKDATNNGNNSNSNTQKQNQNDKDNAVEADTLNLNVVPNGDGTGVLVGTLNGDLKGNLNIPTFVKVKGQLTKITSVGKGAFEVNKLTSVTIPNSVTDIGNYAFANNQLTSVSIPNSVTRIGDGAFGVNNLTSITIPNGVKTIGKTAFTRNKNLASVTIPNSVTDIGQYAFNVCALSSINIPNQQGYQSAISNEAFDIGIPVTNNLS